MTNQRLHHYDIVRKLGQGAHGVVYFAYDTRLLRPVVVKMLHGRGSAERAARQRARILREARLASAIDHQNVCAIYEVHDAESDAFIVMQYVPGRPLATLLEGARLGISFALAISTQIAAGLAAAHDLGIVHRDLKPANVMITEDGLVKILDFGLARRAPELALATREVAAVGSPTSSRAGTVGYMAPEQFIGRPATPQSDIFAIGVVMYTMIAGIHPFWTFRSRASEVARAIQFSRPQMLHERDPKIPAALGRLVARALAKNPADRYESAAELHDALTTLTEAALPGPALPGRLVAPAPPPATTPATRRTGLWAMLSAFISGARPGPPRASVAVLPFEQQTGGEPQLADQREAQHPDLTEPPRSSEASHDERPGPSYGFALANAIATKLARLPGISVRAARSLLALDSLPREAGEAGRELAVSHVISGTYSSGAGRFVIAWQLVDVDTETVAAGDTLELAAFDPVAVQSEVAEGVAAILRGAAGIPSVSVAPTAGSAALPDDVSEAYLEARALLTTFVLRSRRRRDLDAARDRLATVVERAPEFAPAHSALGIAHVHFVQNGFGDVECLQLAADAFDRALALDPPQLEARIFRVHTLMCLGQKDGARHAIHQLLETEPDDFNVRVVAATLLRLDGAYDEALQQLAVALQVNPGDAHVVYHQRARIYRYCGDLERARREADKALELQPHHPLIRVTDGYLKLYEADRDDALAILEAVVADDPTLQVALPTLALARWRAGNRDGARALVTDRTRAAADCDPESAYRLATFYAVSEDLPAALRWLRRAIYLGNENAPWFAENPAWKALREDARFEAILDGLDGRHRKNLELWRRLVR